MSGGASERAGGPLAPELWKGGSSGPQTHSQRGLYIWARWLRDLETGNRFVFRVLAWESRGRMVWGAESQGGRLNLRTHSSKFPSPGPQI